MGFTTFSNRESSVVQKHVTDTMELEADAVTVAVTADTEIGDVLYNDSGTWRLVNAANVSNAAGVLIDPALRFNRPDAGNHTMLVFRRLGVVNGDNLNFASDVNTTTLRNSAIAALLTQNIKVSEGF